MAPAFYRPRFKSHRSVLCQGSLEGLVALETILEVGSTFQCVGIRLNPITTIIFTVIIERLRHVRRIIGGHQYVTENTTLTMSCFILDPDRRDSYDGPKNDSSDAPPPTSDTIVGGADAMGHCNGSACLMG